MATITEPTAVMWATVDAYEDEYPSAVFSGINGDAEHQTRPGKHLSRGINMTRWPGSWPVTAPNDQRGPLDKAVAVDISMSKSDMIKCHNRNKAVYFNRASDPRAKFCYAFNGWDGNGDPGRYNLYLGTVRKASKDHTWHVHDEGYYAFVNDPQFARATRSRIRGETVAQYLGEDNDVGTLEGEQAIQLDRTNNRMLSTITLTPTIVNKAKYGYTESVETNKLVLEVLAQREIINRIAAEVGLNPGELQEIRDAAFEGAQAGAANVEAVAAAVVERLNTTGLTEEQEADVRAAVSAVLLHGAATAPE